MRNMIVLIYLTKKDQQRKSLYNGLKQTHEARPDRANPDVWECSAY